MAVDHEVALEEALQQISGDVHENEDGVPDCGAEEERMQTLSYSTPLRRVSTTFTTEVGGGGLQSRFCCVSAGRSIVKQLMYTPRNAYSDTEDLSHVRSYYISVCSNICTTSIDTAPY